MTAPTARLAVLILVALAVAGACVGIVLDQLRGPEWQASTDVLVQVSSVDALLLTGQAATVSNEDIADSAAMAVSQPVLTRVAQQMNEGQDWTDLSARVSALPVASSHVVSITAKATDPEAAVRTSEVVATTVSDIAKERMQAAAAKLSPITSANDSELGRRAQLMTSSLEPLQVIGSGQARQLTPSVQTPISLAIVGMAAGALFIVALALLRPAIRRPRDAQRLVALPSAGFVAPDGGPEVSRLITGLMDGRPNGTFIVCPVDIGAEQQAKEFVRWARARHFDNQAAGVRLIADLVGNVGSKPLRAAEHAGRAAEHESRVLLTADPAGTVLTTRQQTATVAALLVVVPTGTPGRVLSDAVALLATWRPVDAVIVT